MADPTPAYSNKGPKLELWENKKQIIIVVVKPRAYFHLLSWSPNHLEFFLQDTWLFSIFTPNDLEAKYLANSQVTLIADLEISWVAHSNIVICILYLFKFIYVTLYGMFHNICKKGSQHFLDS